MDSLKKRFVMVCSVVFLCVGLSYSAYATSVNNKKPGIEKKDNLVKNKNLLNKKRFLLEEDEESQHEDKKKIKNKDKNKIKNLNYVECDDDFKKEDEDFKKEDKDFKKEDEDFKKEDEDFENKAKALLSTLIQYIDRYNFYLGYLKKDEDLGLQDDSESNKSSEYEEADSWDNVSLYYADEDFHNKDKNEEPRWYILMKIIFNEDSQSKEKFFPNEKYIFKSLFLKKLNEEIKDKKLNLLAEYDRKSENILVRKHIYENCVFDETDIKNMMFLQDKDSREFLSSIFDKEKTFYEKFVEDLKKISFEDFFKFLKLQFSDEYRLRFFRENIKFLVDDPKFFTFFCDTYRHILKDALRIKNLTDQVIFLIQSFQKENFIERVLYWSFMQKDFYSLKVDLNTNIYDKEDDDDEYFRGTGDECLDFPCINNKEIKCNIRISKLRNSNMEILPSDMTSFFGYMLEEEILKDPFLTTVILRKFKIKHGNFKNYNAYVGDYDTKSDSVFNLYLGYFDSLANKTIKDVVVGYRLSDNSNNILKEFYDRVVLLFKKLKKRILSCEFTEKVFIDTLDRFLDKHSNKKDDSVYKIYSRLKNNYLKFINTFEYYSNKFYLETSIIKNGFDFIVLDENSGDNKIVVNVKGPFNVGQVCFKEIFNNLIKDIDIVEDIQKYRNERAKKEEDISKEEIEKEKKSLDYILFGKDYKKKKTEKEERISREKGRKEKENLDFIIAKILCALKVIKNFENVDHDKEIVPYIENISKQMNQKIPDNRFNLSAMAHGNNLKNYCANTNCNIHMHSDCKDEETNMDKILEEEKAYKDVGYKIEIKSDCYGDEYFVHFLLERSIYNDYISGSEYFERKYRRKLAKNVNFIVERDGSVRWPFMYCFDSEEDFVDFIKYFKNKIDKLKKIFTLDIESKSVIDKKLTEIYKEIPKDEFKELRKKILELEMIGKLRAINNVYKLKNLKFFNLEKVTGEMIEDHFKNVIIKDYVKILNNVKVKFYLPSGIKIEE